MIVSSLGGTVCHESYYGFDPAQDIGESEFITFTDAILRLLTDPVTLKISHERSIVPAATQIIHVIFRLSVFLGSLGVTPGYAVR